MADTVKNITLEGLTAWLETKPPQERYGYLDSRRCLIAQYVNSLGPIAWIEVGPYSFATERDTVYFGWSIGTVSSDYHGSRDWTFGGALKRAKELANA